MLDKPRFVNRVMFFTFKFSGHDHYFIKLTVKVYYALKIYGGSYYSINCMVKSPVADKLKLLCSTYHHTKPPWCSSFYWPVNQCLRACE